MNSALRWLLDLDSLGFGQEGVQVDFARPLPAWGWALVIGAASFLAWRGYRRLEGSASARAFLAGCRAALIVILALVISGPRLIKPNETEERDWVLVLVDRSASLTVRDVPAPAGASAVRITREEQLRSVLDASRQVWLDLAAERVVVWLGFDGSTYELDVRGEADPAGWSVELGEPVGRRTSLARALEGGLKRAAARPLSGVVILSDGRSLDEPGRALVRRLEAERIPVFAVALGSEQALADVAVRTVDGPRVAFVDDAVPVQVELERLGPASTISRGDVVQLIDESSGAVLDEHEIDWQTAADALSGSGGEAVGAEPSISDDGQASHTARITLSTRPSTAGGTKWSVRVVPRGSTGAAVEDLVAENNRTELAVELVDRPLRVLYLDGYPRWEHRFLKTVLLREKSLASSVMLLAPGRRYLQEGTVTIDSLPRSPEEWAKFDCLVMGDCLPSVFTTEQLEQIRDRVGVAGAGLIWIAGEGAVPGAWRGTPLEDLLPITLADGGPGRSGSAGVAAWDEPVTMTATPIADRLGVLRLSDEQVDGSWWPRRLSDPSTGWSQLFWAQRIRAEALKPTAEILATVRPIDAASGSDDSPIVLSMRFGAGRVLYIGTDEIWRWRYGRGDFLPERFWVQLLRLLGRESLARSGKSAVLEVTPRRGEVDRPIRVDLTLIDQAMLDSRPAQLRVQVVREGGVSGAASGDPGSDVTELVLIPESAGAASVIAPGAGRKFSTTFLPTESGRYRVQTTDPLLSAAGGVGLVSRIEIWQAEDELRRPQADHGALRSLCEATGGRLISPDELAEIGKLLPNRRLRLAGEPDVETLWDTPLTMILVLLLTTTEWIGRRLLRLA